MTRTGALLWKEGRDHRASLLVLAGLIPLACWPVQRWLFKFAEPVWTWEWLLPFAVAIALVIVAADLFAMDVATSRMASFAALPVPVRRHFTARTLFLALAGAAFALWTAAANVAIVGIWGKPGAALLLLDHWTASASGLGIAAAMTSGVVLFSALGIGGFRAVLAGALLAGAGCASVSFALSCAGVRSFEQSTHLLTVIVSGGVGVVIASAAYAALVGGRAHAVSRRRGALLAGAIVVLALGAPSAQAGWRLWRGFVLSPSDAEIELNTPNVSPDERHLTIWAQKQHPFGGAAYASWVVRIEDGALFDWPRRDELAAGWTKDGLVWAGRMTARSDETDYGRFAAPETGATVAKAFRDGMDARMARGFGFGPSWAQWLRYEYVQQPGRSNWSTLKLGVKGGDVTRVVEGRGLPCPTKEVGRALYCTAENKLMLVDIAGGEPRVVAEDAKGISILSCSPVGTLFLVTTSKGAVVLDGSDWRCVAGPFDDKGGAHWCGGSETRAVLAFPDADGRLVRLLDVAAGREVVPEPSLGVLGGYCSVATLSDGRFVARAGTNGLLLLDQEGRLIRRLFPPE
jgi:hypothetical protein